MKRIDGNRLGKHREGTKAHTFWSSEDEWDGVKAKAEALGDTVSGMIRGIGTGVYEVRKTAKGKRKNQATECR